MRLKNILPHDTMGDYATKVSLYKQVGMMPRLMNQLEVIWSNSCIGWYTSNSTQILKIVDFVKTRRPSPTAHDLWVRHIICIHIPSFFRRRRRPEVGLKILISPQWSMGWLSDLQTWKLYLLLNNSVQTELVAQGKQMLHQDNRKTRISPER